MVAFTVNAELSPRLRKILAEIGPETRRALFSVGANALRLEGRRHVRREAGIRHSTARRLTEQSNFPWSIVPATLIELAFPCRIALMTSSRMTRRRVWAVLSESRVLGTLKRTASRESLMIG